MTSIFQINSRRYIYDAYFIATLLNNYTFIIAPYISKINIFLDYNCKPIHLSIMSKKYLKKKNMQPYNLGGRYI